MDALANAEALRDLADHDPLARKKAGPPHLLWCPSLRWALVFILNLIVPLFFGWQETQKSGRAGMFVGILALMIFSSRANSASRPLERAWVLGGSLIAMTQFWPILAMFSGLFALGLTAHVGWAAGPHVPEVTCEAGGLLATLITGGLLMTVSFSVGMFLLLIFDGKGHEPR